MTESTSRRQFLTRLGGLAAGTALGVERLLAAVDEAGSRGPRVVIARDEALTRGQVDDHRELLQKLLDAALQKLTGAKDAATCANTGLYLSSAAAGATQTSRYMVVPTGIEY